MAGYENAEPEVAGVRVPDTRLAAEATELVRETAPELIYHHSRRVYYFGALRGKRRGLSYDPELLYLGAMFHDLGLGEEYRNSGRRFEVDSADEARRFLAARAVPEDSIRRVWTAIALHTTPGIPEFMEPEVALVTAGVEYDVLGLGYDSLDEADRTAIVARHPRPDFKRRILAAFTEGVAPQARDHLRQRQGRRPRPLRSRFHPGRLRHHHRGVRLAGVGDPTAVRA